MTIGRKLFIRASLTVLAFFFVGLFAIAVLSYSGFCFKEKRYLSDREKIELAIKDQLATYPPAIQRTVSRYQDGKLQQVQSRERPKYAIPYRDIEEFLALNPDCCKLVQEVRAENGEGNRVNLWDRVWGRTSCFVHMKYLVRYGENETLQSHKVETYPAISNCGYVWNAF